MSDKPSYLGLLNAIAVAEGDAEVFLSRWAEVTPREDVRQVLHTVALREGEHAKAFEKRICELGYQLRPGPGDPKRAEVAGSTELTDREKFEKFGLGDDPGDGPDIFAGMFDDTTIDIQTGALLGRYIAEERDTGRLLRTCYRQLVTDEDGTDDEPDDHGTGSPGDELVAVNERLDRIEAALERLGGSTSSKPARKPSRKKPAKATKRASGKKK